MSWPEAKHEIKVVGKDIPEDEPLFLIRAQDKNGPDALDAYADLLDSEANGLGGLEMQAEQIDLRDQALQVRAFANRMRRWQLENADKVKSPD